MKKNFMLANGWGIIHDETGEHWVYIPLWDPVKFSKVGRALFATMVIRQHLGAVTNKEAKLMLQEVVKEQASIVAGGFVKAMEEGDGWCGTPYPHHFPGGGGVIGGDPDNPVYRKGLGIALSANINAKAAISLLGNALKNKAIIKAAEMM